MEGEGTAQISNKRYNMVFLLEESSCYACVPEVKLEGKWLHTISLGSQLVRLNGATTRAQRIAHWRRV